MIHNKWTTTFFPVQSSVLHRNWAYVVTVSCTW